MSKALLVVLTCRPDRGLQYTAAVILCCYFQLVGFLTYAHYCQSTWSSDSHLQYQNRQSTYYYSKKIYKLDSGYVRHELQPEDALISQKSLL